MRNPTGTSGRWINVRGEALSLHAAPFHATVFGRGLLWGFGMLFVLSALAACSMLQTLPPQEPSYAIAPDQKSRLGVAVANPLVPKQGESMFRLLESGLAALVAAWSWWNGRTRPWTSSTTSGRLMA